MDISDIDPNFEPQTRARSNTWPLPRPENVADKEDDKSTVMVQDHNATGIDQCGQPPKKNSSRRNAWGNMSYAELITQAIQSSPEQRLTLSQIYDWMVQNVPYFKDKGDSNSSAGWKNSIRHNLSLHSRFMRVQNEGTGKSSWWLINPEAKPGKAARRRATSMETQKYEKKRGRVKKKVEALRNGLDATPSPSSSVSEGLDMFPESPIHHNYQLSPDFRPRASSNASSCGRLSPIPAVETDMHDSQVPPLSPINWNSECNNTGSVYGPTGAMDHYGTDQLVDSLAENMKLGTTGDPTYISPECGLKTSPTGQLSPVVSQPIVGTGYNNMVAFGSHYRNNGNGQEYRPFQSSATDSATLTTLGTSSLRRQQSSPQPLLDNSYTLTNLQGANSPNHNLEINSAYNRPPQARLPSSFTTIQQRACLEPQTSGSIMRQQNLIHKESQNIGNQSNVSISTSLSSTANQVMGHLLSLNNPLPNDLDLNFDNLQDLDCDVDQVIHHELSVDGTLDFNFDPMNSSVSMPPTTLTASNRPWVH